MEKVIKSPNLFVMQIEVDTYNLVKTWMFLKMDSSWEGIKKDLLSDANAYFQARVGDRAFLETDEGSKYTSVFQAIRLHHVICDVKAVKQLDQDKIIPSGKLCLYLVIACTEISLGIWVWDCGILFTLYGLSM